MVNNNGLEIVKMEGKKKNREKTHEFLFCFLIFYIFVGFEQGYRYREKNCNRFFKFVSIFNSMQRIT